MIVSVCLYYIFLVYPCLALSFKKDSICDKISSSIPLLYRSSVFSCEFTFLRAFAKASAPILDMRLFCRLRLVSCELGISLARAFAPVLPILLYPRLSSVNFKYLIGSSGKTSIILFFTYIREGMILVAIGYLRDLVSFIAP